MTFKKQWELYEYLSKKKVRCSVIDIKYDFGWSTRKIKRYLKKLVKNGLVKSFAVGSTIFEEEWRPRTVDELIDWNEMTHGIDKFDFGDI